MTLSTSREKTTGLVAAGFWCLWGVMEERWVKNSENLSLDTYTRFFLLGAAPLIPAEVLAVFADLDIEGKD